MFKEYEENTEFNNFQITSGAQERSRAKCLWTVTVEDSDFEGMDGAVELQ